MTMKSVKQATLQIIKAYQLNATLYVCIGICYVTVTAYTAFEGTVRFWVWGYRPE